MLLEILKVIEKYKNEGYFENENVIRIGKAPYIAELAWLHRIPKGLSEDLILEIENKIEKTFPVDFKNFLKESNGIKFFNTNLSIDGYRANYKRDMGAADLPFDIISLNVNESPRGTPDNVIIIGGYGFDGSKVFIDNKGKVGYTKRENFKPEKYWDSLEVFLITELNRLCQVFDLFQTQKKIEGATTYRICTKETLPK